MKSCRSSMTLLLKKWILCLALFSGLHQVASAVHDDQLIISLESYQLTLLGLPQEILLDHNFKKEIDVVMYLATQQLGHERIATVIQILSADYGSPIDNLTTFIQAALKKFTLIPTERNQLLFTLLFMTSLLKQHAHVPLTRNLSVIEFHHEFHAAATTVQQAFQTTAEQLKQFLPPPPRKSWLKKALAYSIIGAAAFTVWWLITHSSREKPVAHEKRGAAPEAVPELVDVPALVADIVNRLRGVEHGIEADIGRVQAAHDELAAATHEEVRQGIAASRQYTDGAVAGTRGELAAQLAQLQGLQERFAADLARLTEAETAARTAAIETLRGELIVERGAREGAIVAETRDRIAAIEAERARNDNARAEERRRVDTGLQALGGRIGATEGAIVHLTRDLADIMRRLAPAEERLASHSRTIGIIETNATRFQAIIAEEREAANRIIQQQRASVDGVAGVVGNIAGYAAAAAVALNPAVALPAVAALGPARALEVVGEIKNSCVEKAHGMARDHNDKKHPLLRVIPRYDHNLGDPVAAAAPAAPVA